jgi:hypothetical protein
MPWISRGDIKLWFYPFFNLGARWGWVVNASPRPLYPRETDTVSIVQKAGWAPEPIWTGEESPAPSGILSPYRPTRRESLYRLNNGFGVLTKVHSNIHCNHHHNHEICTIIHDCLLCVFCLSSFLSYVQDSCARKACIQSACLDPFRIHAAATSFSCLQFHCSRLKHLIFSDVCISLIISNI